jgi:hypothetical protein
MNEANSLILIYQPEDGKTRIDVRLENESVWLTQGQIVELFQTSKPNISMHIRNIFAERELDANSVVKEYLTTAADGKNYRTKYYNLDVIIAVGYRVRSHRGTQFRRWGTPISLAKRYCEIPIGFKNCIQQNFARMHIGDFSH